MIVIVIIGLVAAMAIPAHQRVKLSAIAKEVIAGRVVSDAQLEYLNENLKHLPEDTLARLPRKNQTVFVAEVESFQTVVINGRTYKLVPQ